MCRFAWTIQPSSRILLSKDIRLLSHHSPRFGLPVPCCFISSSFPRFRSKIDICRPIQDTSAPAACPASRHSGKATVPGNGRPDRQMLPGRSCLMEKVYFNIGREPLCLKSRPEHKSENSIQEAPLGLINPVVISRHISFRFHT